MELPPLASAGGGFLVWFVQSEPLIPIRHAQESIDLPTWLIEGFATKLPKKESEQAKYYKHYCEPLLRI